MNMSCTVVSVTGLEDLGEGDKLTCRSRHPTMAITMIDLNYLCTWSVAGIRYGHYIRATAQATRLIGPTRLFELHSSIG